MMAKAGLAWAMKCQKNFGVSTGGVPAWGRKGSIQDSKAALMRSIGDMATLLVGRVVWGVEAEASRGGGEMVPRPRGSRLCCAKHLTMRTTKLLKLNQ